MSIVPDFAYDVFISYAHVNDQRIAEDDHGWVTDLHDVLSKKLLEEMRVRPKIWRDEGGLDGKQIHQGIEEALRSSAVFLAVVSAAYLESEYCDRELQAFVGQPAGRFPLTVRGHKRLVTVGYDSEDDAVGVPRAVRRVSAARRREGSGSAAFRRVEGAQPGAAVSVRAVAGAATRAGEVTVGLQIVVNASCPTGRSSEGIAGTYSRSLARNRL
jgi:hypothetical protein